MVVLPHLAKAAQVGGHATAVVHVFADPMECAVLLRMPLRYMSRWRPAKAVRIDELRCNRGPAGRRSSQLSV